MKKLIPITIYILILTTQVSCGTVGTRISGSYDFNKNDNMGLIAVSNSMYDNCQSVGNLITNIVNTNGEYGATPIYSRLLFGGSDFTNPPGHFFVIELPAGLYKFANVAASGLTLSARSSKLNKDITFSVLPNKVTYVGELEYTINSDCRNYSFQIKNNWRRDRNLFIERIININPNNIEINIAKIN